MGSAWLRVGVIPRGVATRKAYNGEGPEELRAFSRHDLPPCRQNGRNLGRVFFRTVNSSRAALLLLFAPRRWSELIEHRRRGGHRTDVIGALKTIRGRTRPLDDESGARSCRGGDRSGCRARNKVGAALNLL